ncbi:CPBP family intramembrane glutamic endopeptidase [Anaeromicropila populeti]|uniref:CAAX prenyl protease 2/Lysostaphin resistance protein A-like domain-containing protein n=1 Tax=Anaeromicropila populeti TaxID=37658 RepID=A0A1I6J3B9_9FIRM|nr:type II CAAX endopeptidase family protein [Anaeromicropila populeti]SFR73361.1 hypothetical protein SAMN05661086_01401 [Anaeromicropila populeti]
MTRVNEINQIFLWTIVSAVGGSVLYVLLGLPRDDFFLSLAFNQIILVIPTFAYVLKNKINAKEFFRFNKIKIVNVFLLILFSFFITPIMQLINMLSLLFSENVINEKLESIVEGKPLVLSLIIIAVIPALLEESVYRGAFLTEYRKIDARRGVLLCGLLFGLLHLNFNQFSYAFVMGMIFAILVEGTGSIVSSMIVHFCINATSVMTLYIKPYLQEAAIKVYGEDMADKLMLNRTLTKKEILTASFGYSFYAIATLMIAIILYTVIVKNEGRWEYIKKVFGQKNQVKNVEGQSGQKLITIPLAMGMGICILIMILTEVS